MRSNRCDGAQVRGRNLTENEHVKLGAYHTLELGLNRPVRSRSILFDFVRLCSNVFDHARSCSITLDRVRFRLISPPVVEIGSDRIGSDRAHSRTEYQLVGARLCSALFEWSPPTCSVRFRSISFAFVRLCSALFECSHPTCSVRFRSISFAFVVFSFAFVRLCSTLFDFVQFRSTLFDFVRLCSIGRARARIDRR